MANYILFNFESNYYISNSEQLFLLFARYNIIELLYVSLSVMYKIFTKKMIYTKEELMFLFIGFIYDCYYQKYSCNYMIDKVCMI